MKGILIDKNGADAFVCFEDGSTLSLPLCQVENSNIGDTVSFSSTSIPINNNTRTNTSVGNDKLIDFF